MKRLIMILVTLVTLTANCWAGNSVYIQQDNQDADGSIYIKQDGASNSFGISTSAPFRIVGDNLTLIIKQIGNSNLATDSNHKSFKGSNMTFDYLATGSSNVLRLDLDDTGADGHYYDIDITGSSNIVEVDTHGSDDVQDTHLGLDIVGTMCLPPIDNDPSIYFLEMKKITEILNLKEISMGMSEDYLKAIEHSSTYLRIGSKIFGPRS